MENSKIEWTDHTFNPWIAAGCQHCYAEALMDRRYGRVEWGPQGERVRTSDANWRKPLQWNANAANAVPPTRQRVFCASLADVFEDRPELDAWRIELFDMIEYTKNLDWLILTKRPENINPFLFGERHGFILGGGDYIPNVMFGTSVENQEQADKRIPELVKVENHRLFLSIEPLLGPVDLSGWLVGDGQYEKAEFMLRKYGSSQPIDWVIVGGESGPHARPMRIEWVRSIRYQCQFAGVPFFFKQWGEYDSDMKRVGKKNAGRLLDGLQWDEYPCSSTEVIP